MKNYTKIIAVILLCAIVNISFSIAQIPIYNFSFDNDLDGWSTIGVSSLNPDSAANAVWMHTSSGAASLGAFSTNLPIISISGGGAVFFDSDFFDNGGMQGNFGNGRAPSPQRSELISPDLDFSTCEKVYLAFNQYYRYFAHSLDDIFTPNSIVEVSNDGGNTWTSFVINEEVLLNRSTRTSNIQLLDITDIAAGESQVQVRFVWEGDYYFWIIDDVRFFKEIGQNLSVVYITLPSNFRTPDHAFECDSFDMELRVANHGDTIAENVQVTVGIINPDGALIYSDTGIIESIVVGDSVNYDFERDYKPPLLDQGTYVVIYSARIGEDNSAEVVNSADNNLPEIFVINDITLDKADRADVVGILPPLNNEWIAANYYRFPEEFARFQESFKISTIFWQCFQTDGDIPLTGNNFLVYIIELPAEVIEHKGSLLDFEADLLNFDETTSLDDFIAQGLVKGIGSYQFTAADNNSFLANFSADVVDFEEGEGPVFLEPGKKYFLAIRYQGNAATFAHSTSARFMYFQITSVLYDDLNNQWLPLINPFVIGAQLELVTTADEKPLPESTVHVYPNPAMDYFHVELDFDRPTDTGILIADATGKILNFELEKQAINSTKVYSTEFYPSGTYIVRILTERGTKTEQIIIHK